MKRLPMMVAILALAAMVAINLTWDFSQKPDVVYPMCNQRIEWD